MDHRDALTYLAFDGLAATHDAALTRAGLARARTLPGVVPHEPVDPTTYGIFTTWRETLPGDFLDMLSAVEWRFRHVEQELSRTCLTVQAGRLPSLHALHDLHTRAGELAVHEWAATSTTYAPALTTYSRTLADIVDRTVTIARTHWQSPDGQAAVRVAATALRFVAHPDGRGCGFWTGFTRAPFAAPYHAYPFQDLVEAHLVEAHLDEAVTLRQYGKDGAARWSGTPAQWAYRVGGQVYETWRSGLLGRTGQPGDIRAGGELAVSASCTRPGERDVCLVMDRVWTEQFRALVPPAPGTVGAATGADSCVLAAVPTQRPALAAIAAMFDIVTATDQCALAVVPADIAGVLDLDHVAVPVQPSEPVDSGEPVALPWARSTLQVAAELVASGNRLAEALTVAETAAA